MNLVELFLILRKAVIMTSHTETAEIYLISSFGVSVKKPHIQSLQVR